MENFKNKNKKDLKFKLKTSLNLMQPFLLKKRQVLVFSVQSFKTRGQAPSFSWKKSILTTYYLVIAYQKTLRVKLNDYFKNSTKTRFFFAMSPFIVYFIQISLEKSEWKYQQNTFLQKSLPRLSKPIQEISWETFAYTKYSNQMNSNFINDIYSVDNCFFISLNPVWQLKQKQFFTGTFESFTEKNAKWSFLPSRCFYQLMPETQKKKFKESVLGNASVFKDPLQNSQARLGRQIKINSRWQIYFNELDDIPTKLNSVFQYEKPFLKQQKETMNPPVVFLFEKPLTFVPVSTLNQEMLSQGDSTDLVNPKSALVAEREELETERQKALVAERDAFVAKKFENLGREQELKKGFTEFNERFLFLSSNYHERRKRHFKENSEKQTNFWQQNGFSTIQSRMDDEIDFQACEPTCFTEKSKKVSQVEKSKKVSQAQKATSSATSSNLREKFGTWDVEMGLDKTSFENLDANKGDKTFLRNSSFPQKTKKKVEVSSREIALSKSTRSINFQRKKIGLNSIWLVKPYWTISVLKKKNLIGLLSEKNNQTAFVANPNSSLNVEKRQSQKSKKVSQAQKVFSAPSSSDLTWIDFLIEKFNKNLSQEQRNFQYNINFGFSQFGKIIKLNSVLKPRKIEKLSQKTEKTTSQKNLLSISNFVDNSKSLSSTVDFLRGATKASAKSQELDAQKQESKRLVFDFVEKKKKLNSTSSLEISSIWQNEIRNHLTSPQPVWIKELINQNQQFKEKTVSCSLIKMSHFEFLSKLSKNFKFDKSTTNVLNKKPDLILGFFKKSTKLKNKQTFSLTVNPLMKRKLSGYLYPDSLRDTLLRNFSQFKIGNEFQIPFFHLQNVMDKNFFHKFEKLRRRRMTTEKSEIVNYQNGFLSILSPNLLNQNKKAIKESLIQIYQPLIENSSTSKKKGARAQKDLFENQVKSVLNSPSSLQKPEAFLNWIDPDKSFTVKKKDFFGSPIKSPIHGLTLEEYKKKYVTGQKKIEKNNLISPYTDSQNFIIQSLSKAKTQLHDDSEKSFLTSGIDITEIPKTNLLKDAWKSNLEIGLIGQTDKTKSLIELTKAPTYSTVFLEPASTWFLPHLRRPLALIKQNSNIKKLFSPAQKDLSEPSSVVDIKKVSPLSDEVAITNPDEKSFQFANENSFGFSQKALSYKANLHSTKSKFSLQTGKKTLSGVEKQMPDEGVWEKTFKQKTFSATLYEPLSLKSWSILSQFGFAFIILKVAEIFKKEYQEEVGYYMNEFFFMLKDYPEFSFLFPSKENFRVIKNIKKKFSDLVGGRFLLTELGEILLILRNSRKVFSKLEIAPPSPLIVSDNFYNSFSQLLESNNVVFQQQNRFSTKPFFSVSKTFFINNRHFAKVGQISDKGFTVAGTKLKKVSTPLNSTETPFLPNLKFENFIPKGVLLVGPPGTGKTLLVQALAGEATVPILIESGKMFTTDTKTQGSEQLKDLFKAAREISPCILFLDEVDTIGQKRENVLSTDFAASGEKESKIPNPLNRIYFQNLLTNKKNSSAQVTSLSPFFINESFSEFNWDVLNPLMRLQITKNLNTKQNQETNHFQIQLENKINESSERQKEDLELLTQLLCELDGLNKRQEIIVIGATNRPATLDTALTRPGRFGKVLYLDLPGKQKRLSLLKFYSRSRNGLSGRRRPSTNLALAKQEPFWQQSWKFFSLRSKRFFKLPDKPFFTGSKRFVEIILWPPFMYKLPNVLSPLKNNQKLWQGEPKSIGVAENVNWNYFANQTVGLSAAHLSAAMNRSAFKAIFISFSKKSAGYQKAFQTGEKSWFVTFKKLFTYDSKNLGIKNQMQQRLRRSHKKKELPDQGDLLVTKLSKNLKLKLLAQLGQTNRTESLNNLTAFAPYKDSSDQQFHSIKNQPFHTFETIEYGIKTISTMTQSVEINLTKGKQVNKKIMGQLVLDDFLFQSKEFFLTTNAPKLFSDAFVAATSSKKGSVSKRHFFYQKNFQYLRTLALLNGKSKIQKGFASLKTPTSVVKSKVSQAISSPIDSQATWSPILAQQVESQKKTPDYKIQTLAKQSVAGSKSYFVDAAEGSSKKFLFFILFHLKVLSKYVNRITKNQSFGWVLLFNSTCLIQNPLFVASIQKTHEKKITSIYYDLLFLTNEIKKNRSKTLLKWQTFNCINQTSLFSDSLFINRSAYYLSGKALLNASVAQTPSSPVDQPMSLWSFTHPMKSRQKKKFQQSKAFVAKIEFENLLLSLIAGKATEALMLSNQLATQKKKQSNIGVDELKQLGLVIKLMAEKDFFFSQKQLTRNQINIDLFENKKQISQQKELLFLKELATLFENQKQTLTQLPTNPLKLYDEFKSGDQPWWQFQSIDLLSSLNLKYSDWYRFFTSDEQENFRNIEWIAPDSYFHNQLNNAHLVSTKTNRLRRHSGLEKNNSDQAAIIYEKSFVNPKLVLKYIEFSKLNWNQIQLLESDLVASYYLFELFNKVFVLLENNRELLDSLVYSLICYESLRDFEIINSHRRYFKDLY